MCTLIMEYYKSLILLFRFWEPAHITILNFKFDFPLNIVAFTFLFVFHLDYEK